MLDSEIVSSAIGIFIGCAFAYLLVEYMYRRLFLQRKRQHEELMKEMEKRYGCLDD